MDVDAEARAPSANSTCEGSIESHKQPDTVPMDDLPETTHSPPGVSTEVAPVKEEVALPPKPNYHAKFILSGHTMSISSLKFSPDGALLASSGAFITLVQIELSDSMLSRSKPPTS